MRRRIVELEGGNYSLIEDDENVKVTIIGATDVAEVVDDKTWESLRKNANDHAKVNSVIRNNEKNGKIRNIRRSD